jgi:hypothetical protein
MVIGLFISTTAVSLPEPMAVADSGAVAEQVALAPSQRALAAVAQLESSRPQGMQNAVASTFAAHPEMVAEPDPSRSDIIAHHATTTLPGDVVTRAVEDSDRLWSLGIELFSPVPKGALPDLSQPTTPDECHTQATNKSLEGASRLNLIAQMTHQLFECVTALEGLDEVEPTKLRRWNGATVWGFQSLSEQIAAESVVVAYCESLGFADHALYGNNPWGYGGLFQLGRTEFSRFDGVGGSRFDPVDNAYAAARYFVFQYENRAGWGGWSPWAVVNTNFDGVNDQVKVPILPRFVSTDPGFAGRRGPELPKWAVDPWTYAVPEWNGCPYNGYRWPNAARL